MSIAGNPRRSSDSPENSRPSSPEVKLLSHPEDPTTFPVKQAEDAGSFFPDNPVPLPRAPPPGRRESIFSDRRLSLLHDELLAPFMEHRVSFASDQRRSTAPQYHEPQQTVIQRSPVPYGQVADAAGSTLTPTFSKDVLGPKLSKNNVTLVPSKITVAAIAASGAAPPLLSQNPIAGSPPAAPESIAPQSRTSVGTEIHPSLATGNQIPVAESHMKPFTAQHRASESSGNRRSVFSNNRNSVPSNSRGSSASENRNSVQGIPWSFSEKGQSVKFSAKPSIQKLPSTNSAFNAGAGAVEGSTANFAPPGCPICPCPPKCAPKDVAQALFKVPVGFQALLKHITRELLNGKPKDPYLYICEYLRVKMHDRRRGLLETDYFDNDTLNIDIKPPMHYLQQTSLHNVTCPSTTAFDNLATDATTTINAGCRGIQQREATAEIRRDPEARGVQSTIGTRGTKDKQAYERSCSRQSGCSMRGNSRR